MKKKSLDLNPTSYTKINSKCIAGFKVKRETIKLLEDNTGKKSSGPQQIALRQAPEVPSIKGKIDELNFIKIKKKLLCRRPC